MHFAIMLLFQMLLFILPVQAQKSEWNNIKYKIKAEAVASKGECSPFWLVSNRHGLSSLENINASLSIALFRDFKKKNRLDWSYGVELAGALNHSSPFYIQQLYADIKFNNLVLSIGSKERNPEGKHPTLSGGGLTFSQNARPIPQVRFGIDEYTTARWLFNEWVHIKASLSYGRLTDDYFQHFYMRNAPIGSRFIDKVHIHEKRIFLKIEKENKIPFSVEMGLEMCTQFGGRVWEKKTNGDVIKYTLPNSFIQYLKAFVPLSGGSESPKMDQTNVDGNVLGSLHLAVNYKTGGWKFKAYYEHFYEDHSGMLGFDYHYNREGKKTLITYLPWRDGLYGIEITVPKNRVINTFLYEFINTRNQSGPILQNPAGDMTGQAGGKDWYYTHTHYQSWQHWGMAICNPHILSPLYNEPANLTMPYSRIHSHHIGFDGTPDKYISYRVLGSWTKHWGSYEDPLPTPLTQLSIMGEINFTPQKWKGWKFTGAIAYDHSKLIGNNFGGMLTIIKEGWLSNK